ncbi:MAG: hypothetical protein QOK15_2866, partial [Nocardioidaceae bacterium]|nr:hypothetical protein [Nocardioidaceae bacterium]
VDEAVSIMVDASRAHAGEGVETADVSAIAPYHSE